jgi:hypothetical protein
MTTLTATLERFKSLNTASEEERKEIFGESGFLHYGSDESTRMLTHPKPRYDQLSAFLNSLSDSHVFALCALMYSGRDKHLDIAIYWKEIGTHLTKNAAITKLLEKTPRIVYIQSAIDQAALTQANLDRLPEFMK